MSGSRQCVIVKQNPKEHWSRHPLLLTLVGFLLTVVLGATVTFAYNRLSTEKEHTIARISARREAILATHKALFEYSGAARHLATEIDIGGPPDALLNAFKLYQEAAAHAYSAIPEADFLLYQRQPGGDMGDTNHRPAANGVLDAVNNMVNSRLLPLLADSDSCLTSRYAHLVTHDKGSQTGDCGDLVLVRSTYPKIPANFVDRMDAYAGCAETFTSVLIALGTDPDETLWNEKTANASILESVKTKIEKTCPSLGAATAPKTYFSPSIYGRSP